MQIEDIIAEGLSPHLSERVRSLSIRTFEETNMVATIATMKEDLAKLADKVPKNSTEREVFEAEIKGFLRLFSQYLLDTVVDSRLNWSKVASPSAQQLIDYKALSPSPSCCEQTKELLDSLAVLKLNGGLGTTMGCVGPKSAIEVRDGLTFLDLVVIQVEHLNKSSGVRVPLILMNSFNTHAETQSIVKKYSNHALDIRMFMQSRYPRIFKDSLSPCPKCYNGTEKSSWYPPGHGDLFDSIYNSGVLQTLIDSGKEWLFISNIDNLGATVDTAILNYLKSTKAEFLMEVTDKTKADIKGGTLIDYEGTVRLLEIAQVPIDYRDDFKSVKKFKIFNTNNVWVSTHAIKRLVESQMLNLEVIPNLKTLETGEKVLQLETAVGAAVKHFTDAKGLVVPRSRFLPVKSTSDLFLVTSDVYKLDRGQLTMNPRRMFGACPHVKLGDHFKTVSAYQSRFKGAPKILEMDHLTVSGDVTFGSDVTLKGTVIIVASHGSRIDIPTGTVLEDKVVTGNLRIMDH